MDPKDGDDSPLADLPLFPDAPPARRRSGQGTAAGGERGRPAADEAPAGRAPERPSGPDRSDLQPPDLEAADLEVADHEAADLEGADFGGAGFDAADLEPPDLERGVFDDPEDERHRVRFPEGLPEDTALPEEAVAAPEAAARPARPGRRRGRELPLFPGVGEGADDQARAGRPRREPAASERWPLGPPSDPQAGPQAGLELDAPPPEADTAPPFEADAGPPADRRGLPAPVSARLAAGALDLALLLAAGGLAVIGAWALDVPLGLAGLAGLAVFVGVFSFAYAVVPLAFWGRTPGMALVGITARSTDGGPLTFGQVGLRWLGALLTLALAALPLLLALRPLGGRSLSDRLSGSNTVVA